MSTDIACVQHCRRTSIVRCNARRKFRDAVLRSVRRSWLVEDSNMFLKTIAACIAAPCLLAPAIAQNAAPDSAGGRYVFNKQADGFVRLDTQTGAVALCSQKAVGLACEAAPEDRAVLENEIARLRSENAALKKDVLSHDLPLPPGANPEPGAASPMAQNGATLQLPSDADIDRMVAYAGQLWHRFIDAVDRAQQQVLNKS